MSVNSKMTALADEIRELSGTTNSKSIDAMTSDVVAANTEIAEQAELIEQIATALESKAAGSSGSGTGTCAVETYDLVIETDGIVKVNTIEYMAYVNGQYQFHSDSCTSAISDYPITIPNVILRAPLKVSMTDGFEPTAMLISNIDYINMRDYIAGYTQSFSYSGIIVPMSTDNRRIVIRCFDDD